MHFDIDEACHVASMFAHEQIAFASNAGADDARFVVVDEFRVMIQRHELWFVQTLGFFARRLLQLHPAVRAPPGRRSHKATTPLKSPSDNDDGIYNIENATKARSAALSKLLHHPQKTRFFQ